jgi:hypothetical protein
MATDEVKKYSIKKCWINATFQTWPWFFNKRQIQLKLYGRGCCRFFPFQGFKGARTLIPAHRGGICKGRLPTIKPTIHPPWPRTDNDFQFPLQLWFCFCSTTVSVTQVFVAFNSPHVNYPQSLPFHKQDYRTCKRARWFNGLSLMVHKNSLRYEPSTLPLDHKFPLRLKLFFLRHSSTLLLPLS